MCALGSHGTLFSAAYTALMFTSKPCPYNGGKFRRIYRETIDCFNSECLTLTAAGLRSLLEGLCSELDVTNGLVSKDGKPKRESNLEGKISGLSEKSLFLKQIIQQAKGSS